MDEGLPFISALLIACAFVVVLHFTGSCLQYFIGKLRWVQEWANFALPPDMLAASDSVLLTAGCFKVGVVGQVFMDTANGLNQGRMNMAFCTQFWSEYASIPTGLCWVATGAVVAVSGGEGSEDVRWAGEAVPIAIMMALIWQMLGTTYGGYALATCSKSEGFWKAKEKWETVQYFARKGVKCTKDAWKRDCFGLAEVPAEMANANVTPLFNRIERIHNRYIRESDEAKKATEKHLKIAQKRYNRSRADERAEHWAVLEKFYFTQKKGEDTSFTPNPGFEEWFDTTVVENDHRNPNEWRTRWKISCGKVSITAQMVLVAIAICSGLASYFGIARNISTEEAVEDGVDTLKTIQTKYWIAFGVYNLVVVIYYWKTLVSSFGSVMSQVAGLLTCVCFRMKKSNVPLETAFKPTWHVNSKRSSRASSRPDDGNVPPKRAGESRESSNGYSPPEKQSPQPSNLSQAPSRPGVSDPKSAATSNSVKLADVQMESMRNNQVPSPPASVSP